MHLPAQGWTIGNVDTDRHCVIARTYPDCPDGYIHGIHGHICMGWRGQIGKVTVLKSYIGIKSI